MSEPLPHSDKSQEAADLSSPMESDDAQVSTQEPPAPAPPLAPLVELLGAPPAAAVWPPADFVDKFQAPTTSLLHLRNRAANKICAIPLDNERMRQLAQQSADGAPLAAFFVHDKAYLKRHEDRTRKGRRSGKGMLPLKDFTFVPAPELPGKLIGIYMHNPLVDLLTLTRKRYGSINVVWHTKPIANMPGFFTATEAFAVPPSELYRAQREACVRKCDVCGGAGIKECQCGEAVFCSDYCQTKARTFGPHTVKACMIALKNSSFARIMERRAVAERELAEAKRAQEAEEEAAIKRLKKHKDEADLRDETAKKRDFALAQLSALRRIDAGLEPDPMLPDVSDLVAQVDAARAEQEKAAAVETGDQAETN